jgi:hypothetical protein
MQLLNFATSLTFLAMIFAAIHKILADGARWYGPTQAS